MGTKTKMTEAGQKTANALLQQSTSIVIAGKEYFVPAPTYATLVRLSAYINDKDVSIDETNPQASDILALARDEATAPEVLAVLVLGAKECDNKKRRFGLFKYGKTKFEELAEYFSNEASVSDVTTAVVDILNNRLELGFFYRGITTLKETNQLKKTKEI